ncbi:hypothetical protein A6A06_05895 [Streptomyces sp. CB02923]|uniref:hypothetical protein n=1 Tax=Streptomyces sp. CB02923 TaxID=1718985 RepID=UPI000938E3D1|nr:hypothetical protein [Streptomyces sp. CB02923]OKI10133.1 hypothetical protein A6A06_05895 [Streptomyces sp. CB02923]
MSENQSQNPYGSYDPYQAQDQQRQPQQPAADQQPPYEAHGSYGADGAYGAQAAQSAQPYGGYDGTYGQSPQQGYGQQPQQPYGHQSYGTQPYAQQQQPQQQPQQHPQQTYGSYGQPQQTAWPAAAGQEQQTGQYGQQDRTGQSGQYATGPDGRPAYGQGPAGTASYGHDAYAAGGGHDDPQTQIWTAPTWDTSVQLPVMGAPEPAAAPDPSAAETAYLPKMSPAPAAARDPQQQPPQQHRAQPGGRAQHRAAPPAAEPERPAAGSEPAPDLSRLAPNQRARAEGRSPIIPPGLQPAALTAALALLLALAAPLPRAALLVPVVLLQAVTAAGWFRLNGMWPARQGIALAFLAGVTTDIALLATERDQAPVVAIGTLGVWCLFILILQLRNRSSADERMYALTAGLTSTALAVLAAGQLAAAANAVTVGCVAVAVATLARALPLPGAASLVVALLGGAGAGIAAGQLTGLGASGALLGLAAGGCALIGLRVASYDYPSRFVHLTAGVALPLALAAPAIYVLGRALV